MKRIAFAALALFCMPAVLAAAPQIVSKQGAGEQSVKSMIGAKVANANGETVGDIDYLLMTTDGKISTVIIGVGGFLGVGEKDVGVAYNEIKPQIDRDGKMTYLLNASKDELKSAPAFEWLDAPSASNKKTSSE